MARAAAAMVLGLGLSACTALVELLDPGDAVVTPGDPCELDSDCSELELGPCQEAACLEDGSCAERASAVGTPCGADGQCDGEGTCVDDVGPGCDSGERDGDESDVDCGGSCIPCELGQSCGGPADCISAACERGVCVPGDGMLGDPCGDPSECQEGNCVDNVCCDTACDGTCESCAASGSMGTCSPHPEGQDPELECDVDVCNGAGACRCTDGDVNGTETDVDCGGGACADCTVGATCAFGSDCDSGVCTGLVCQAPVCGDGIVNGDDACDGNGMGFPGMTAQCDIDCTFSECGDGITNTLAFETCDGDGAGQGGETATCDVDCSAALCGDGITNSTALEACDGDGQGTPGETPTCDLDCSFQLCGDGTVNVAAGEICDGDGLGNGGETSSCDLNCTAQLCGDGTINFSAGEQCDGNGFGVGGETTQCDLDCTLAMCGDGTTNVTRGESCDDGALTSYDGCAVSCRASAMHLLLTEVLAKPDGAAFVEIYNPSLVAVDLSDVYLADYPGYHLVTSGGGSPGATDFRVRFPPGTMLAPNAFVVVSLDSASNFDSAHSVPPSFDLDPLDAVSPAMVDATDPTPTLDADSGMLILFQWDLVSDLVTDLDYLVYGDTSAAVDKTGTVVGSSTYEDDTAAALQDAALAAGVGVSMSRCDTAEGSEIVTGGNGEMGHNETSESLSVTWASSTPNPGAVPPLGVCSP